MPIEVFVEASYSQTWCYRNHEVGADKLEGYHVDAINSINGNNPKKYPKILNALEKMKLEDYFSDCNY